MKILAFGDVHLGAGADYGAQPGDRLTDQAAVLEEIAKLALGAALVLFAGDAFHRRTPTPAELLVWKEFAQSLPVPMIAIAGNHDVARADLPTGLEVVRGGSSHVVARFPKVYRSGFVGGHGGVSVACLPWTPPAYLVAHLHGGDRDEIHETTAELLIAEASRLRSECAIDGPAILLAHWSVSGSALPNGLPVDDLREPVLPLEGLEELGFDYVVLGHIHKEQILTPRIFYTGSPAPVDFGEADVEHGAWRIDTEGDGFPDFLPIESRPFVTLDLDGKALADEAGYYHAMSDWTGAVIRARYEATPEQARRIDHAAIKQALYDAGAHKVYAIQPTIVRSDRARIEGVDETLGPMEALRLYCDHNEIDPELSDRMGARTSAWLQEVEA